MIQPSVAARDKFVFLVLTQTAGQPESLIIDAIFTATTGNAFVALDGCPQHHMPTRPLSCFPNHCLGRELIFPVSNRVSLTIAGRAHVSLVLRILEGGYIGHFPPCH